MGIFSSIFRAVVPRLMGLGRRFASRAVGDLASRGVQALAQKSGVQNIVGQGAVDEAGKVLSKAAEGQADTFFQGTK